MDELVEVMLNDIDRIKAENEKLYCSKLTKEVEPEECCFQFSEKQQYSEAMEKLRRQFVTR